MPASPPAAIRVLVVGSRILTRTALRSLLEDRGAGLSIVGESEHLPELAHRGADAPDVILLVFDCPDDHDRFRRTANADAGGPPVVVITDDHDARLFHGAIHLGAAGVVFKNDTPETLIKAIQKTHAGEVWLRRSQVPDALRSARAGQADPQNVRQVGSLTRREREILALVADGLSNRSIGERLFISEATVRNHVTSILDKLQLRNRSELVAFAFRRGLVRA